MVSWAPGARLTWGFYLLGTETMERGGISMVETDRKRKEKHTDFLFSCPDFSTSALLWLSLFRGQRAAEPGRRSS